jgi:hypothetical protein
MVRCFEAGDTATSSLRYWLAHRLAIPALKARKGLKEIHPIPLNTFIAKRMFVKARSAESAIGDNFYSWVEDMTHEISLLVDAIRTVSPTENRHLLPLLTVNSFPMFFLAISGEKNKTGAEQFLPDLRQTRFQSLSRLKHADLMNLQSHLNSQLPIPIEDYSLGLAETFLHHGYADLAVVQVCVACESVLSRCYREYLLTRGVSKSRFEDSERDITYSSLLNLHLASMCNLSELADHENTLSRLNWARQRRNEIVHRGRVQKRASTEEIEAAITAAGKLVMFLSQKGTEQVSAMSS